MKINFASLRLAFSLIAILLFLIVLSAIIPQRDIAENQILNWQGVLGDNYKWIERLGLDQIYYSPFFFIVLGLLATNLFLGNLKRFRLVFRSRQNLFRLRHLGSLIFHFSILLIMAGVILNYLYKFEGVFALTEGQSATDAPNSYFREFAGPLYKKNYDRFQLTLDRVTSPTDQISSGPVTAEITLQPAGTTEIIQSAIMTNRPLETERLDFHYGMLNGYSPELIIKDSFDNMVLAGFVRLATQRLDGRLKFVDFVLLPDLEMRVEVEVIENKNHIDSLRFKIDVEQGEQSLYDGTMMLGDSVRFDEYVIAIPRMRRWCYIDVVDSPFLGLVFFGFWSALSGLLIGFLARVRGEGGS